MNLNDYQPLARRTMKELPFREHIEHMSAGITGELGELIDAVKKFKIYGKPLDLVNMSEEGGDCWWYNIGFVPELHSSPDTLQRGFNEGLGDALLWTRGPIPLVVRAIAQIGAVCDQLMEFEDVPSEGFVESSLTIIGRNMGRIYGFFGLDLDTSLTANINKLAKRYGDKYSDIAAINRDTGAERRSLEADLKGTSTSITPAATLGMNVVGGAKLKG